MGKKFQRILAILMVLAMVIGTVPIFATAPALTLTKTVTPVTDVAIADDCLYYDIDLAVTGTMPAVQKKTYDIVLVLDTSGSMSGTKLASLKTAAKNFIDQMKAYNENTRIGIVRYAGYAHTVSGLLALTGTNDTTLKDKITNIGTGSGTNVAAGITTGAAVLNGTTNEEIMILMSDGEANLPLAYPNTTAINAATTVKAAGTKIYSIGMSIGNPSTARNTMNSISSGTGYYFDCDASTIGSIYSQIATNLAASITVTDTVGADFTVIGTPTASVGTASFTGKVLTWTFTQAQYTSGMHVTFRVKAAQRIVTDPITGIKTTNSYTSNTNAGLANISFNIGGTPTSINANAVADVTIPGFSLTAAASATNVNPGTEVDLTATPSTLSGRCVGETITYAWTQDGTAWTSSAQNPQDFAVTADTILRVTATTSAGHIASAIVSLTTIAPSANLTIDKQIKVGDSYEDSAVFNSDSNVNALYKITVANTGNAAGTYSLSDMFGTTAVTKLYTDEALTEATAVTALSNISIAAGATKDYYFSGTLVVDSDAVTNTVTMTVGQATSTASVVAEVNSLTAVTVNVAKDVTFGTFDKNNASTATWTPSISKTLAAVGGTETVTFRVTVSVAFPNTEENLWFSVQLSDLLDKEIVDLIGDDSALDFSNFGEGSTSSYTFYFTKTLGVGTHTNVASISDLSSDAPDTYAFNIGTASATATVTLTNPQTSSTSSQTSSTSSTSSQTSSGTPLTNSDPGSVKSSATVASSAATVIPTSSVPLAVISTASSEAVTVISDESVPMASPETGVAGSAAIYAAMTLLTSGIALTIFAKKSKSNKSEK